VPTKRKAGGIFSHRL